MSRLDEMATKSGGERQEGVSYLPEDEDKPSPPPEVRISLNGISIGDLIMFFFKCLIALTVISVPVGILLVIVQALLERH